jgi:hypothetical protein
LFAVDFGWEFAIRLDGLVTVGFGYVLTVGFGWVLAVRFGWVLAVGRHMSVQSRSQLICGELGWHGVRTEQR